MKMPGVRSSMTHGSRADGMFCSVSRSNVEFVPVSRVSTSGLAPVTVTVSCTVAELEGAVDLGTEADGHADVLERQAAEAGQFEGD